MAVTHGATTRTILADAAVDEIDIGAAANGTLVIGTAAMAVTLVTINFSATAFGAASGPTATMAGAPKSGTAVATGTAAAFEIKDKDGTVIMQGSVGTSGEDINLSSVSITTSDDVQITSLTYTAPV